MPEYLAKKERRASQAILIAVFFFSGVLTSLNDVLIPHLKYTFGLSYFTALLIQLVWFMGYFIISYPASLCVNRSSYKQGVIYGFAFFTIGCVCIGFSAFFLEYGLFLGSLFIIASGISVLQVTGNAFGSAIGPEASVHKRLMMFHACFALGTTITPWISGPLILNYSQENHVRALDHTVTVIPVYTVLALLFLCITLITIKLPLPDILAKDRARQNRKTFDEVHSEYPASIFQYRHAVLGAVAAFAYVGTETLTGSFMVNYIQYLGLKMSIPSMAHFIGYYWGGILIGRLLGPYLIKNARPDHLLLLCSAFALVLVFAGMYTNGYTALIAITLTGLCNSVMFPLIYSLSVHSLTPTVATRASGLITTAIVGGALLPLLAAWIADTFVIIDIFYVSLACYLYIVFYALYGCHPARRTS